MHRLWNLWLDYAMDELSACGIDISVLATANLSVSSTAKPHPDSGLDWLGCPTDTGPGGLAATLTGRTELKLGKKQFAFRRPRKAVTASIADD